MILYKNKTIALALLSLLLLNSCASVLNKKSTKLSIIRNKESRLIVNKDTINELTFESKITVPRSKKPLQITVFNDSSSKSVTVTSRSSTAFYMNLLFGYGAGVGFLIDWKKPKRYTYPSTIFLDLNKKDSTYITYTPLAKEYQKKNIIKITPLKAIGFYNSSLEVTYERVTGSSFSTNLMASYLLPINIAFEQDHNYAHNYKGYRFAIEEKYYLKKNAPQGSYISLELDYLQNKYYDYWGFGDEDFPETIYNETFGINKKTYSINAKFGRQYINKRFSIDWYIGVGARYKDVQHFDRSNYDDEMIPSRHINIYYIANKPGKYWTISIPFNIKIGWTF